MIVSLILFIVAAFLCFTIPGVFLISKSKAQFSFWEKVILGTTIGFIFFTLLSYLLMVLNLQFLLLPIILTIDIISLKQIINLKSQITILPKNKLILLALVFLVGVTGQMLVIAPSGIRLNGDLVFWSSHAHDGSWHMALMEEIKKGYPLENPVMGGEKLVNYHFFSDIAPAQFNKYFKLSALDLYFRFFPLLFSILLGALAYLLGSKMAGNFQSGLWAAIFTYFAGSLGYIVTYLQNKTVGGESIFWASQPQSSIGNPPQIIAFIIVLAFLYLFQNFLQSKDKIIFLALALLAGTLVEFKVYGAVVLLASLGIVGIWQLIRTRSLSILLLAITSGILALALYLPNTSKASQFLIFEPWWFVRTMVVAPDRLNWLDLELKRQTYIYENNWKRVIQVETMAFLIFFLGNLGIRFLGLISFIKMSKSFLTNYFNQLFILIIAISLIFPLLFLQKGVATNTIQFLQYFLLLMGILAGLSVSKLLGKIKLNAIKLLISLFIIALAVPTQISLIISFYNRAPFTKIQRTELQALEFLKQNSTKDSVILTPPYNKYLDLGQKIPDIWDWSDTAYVAAFSARRAYLSDTEQVDIMGYDLTQRLAMQESVFVEEDPQIFMEKLKHSGAHYLYFPKATKPAVDLNQTTLNKVFANEIVEIWQVDTKDKLLD